MIRSPGHQVPKQRAGKHASKFRLLARRLHHDFRYNLTSRQRSGLVAYLSSWCPSPPSAASLPPSGQGGCRSTTSAPGTCTSTITFPESPCSPRPAESASAAVIRPACTACSAQPTAPDAPSSPTNFPLLLNLRDIYWTPEGRWALDVAFGIIASVGAYFSGIPLWHGLSEEITGKPAQPGPAPSPDSQTGAGNQEPP